MTTVTYSYYNDHGELITVTEVKPTLIVTDAERVEMGVNEREAEHHAAMPEQSPYSGEYPEEGGLFFAIVGALVFWAILALVVIALAQGAR